MVEILGKTLKAIRQDNEIRGLGLHQGAPPQTHQQVVDDTMLMGHSLIQEARDLKKGLDQFLQASGLDINKEKSQVYFFNTPQITRRNVLRILGFQEGTLPSKYLGATLAKSVVKKISQKELLDKMKTKIENWMFRALNFHSRLTLVHVVLQVMPLYLFSVIAAPKSVLKKIRTLMCNFLWGGTEDHQKWALVDWNTLCTPKATGELGLKDSESSNKVMRARIWWRWITYTNEPWAQLWHRKYALGWEKKNLIRFVEEVPGSHIWKATQMNRLLAQQHNFWEIHNGESTYFFQDSWQ
jgi:hypothetical protein